MLSRRRFLARIARSAALSAPVPFGLASCAANSGKEGPPPSPVVDTHMHVWSGDPIRFPFAHPYDPAFKPPPLAGTVDMLIDEMDAHGVTHAVLVQVIYHGWDNRYVAECVRAHPRRFRAHGLIDPLDPARAEKLGYWMREQGLSGMRFSPIYYQGRDEWLDARESFPLWERASELGAVFNFFIATHQLPRLEQMVRRFPGVRVVIDHLARIDLKAVDPLSELQKLLALARYPAVSVKVSELGEVSIAREYPFRDTFPWVRRLHEAFGPERLLWGTGFPGATRAQAGRPSLAAELNLIRREIPFLSAADREKVLGLNAHRLWGFGAPSEARP